MNRSILIVICDFLVLSALSLSSGSIDSSALFQGQSKKGIARRDLYVEQIQTELTEKRQIETENANLSQSLAQAEQLLKEYKEKLYAADLQLASAKSSEAGSREALNRQEEYNRSLQQRLDDQYQKTGLQQADLAITKDILKKTSDELKQSQADTQNALKKLESSQAELDSKKTELSEKERKLLEAQEQISKQDKELQKKNDELQKRLAELAERERRLLDLSAQSEADQKKIREVEDQLKTTELSIAYMRGQLTAAEEERNLAKELAADTINRLHFREQELKQTKNELGNVRVQLKTSQDNLNKTHGQLQHIQQNLVETRTQLQKTEEYSKEQVQNLQYTREQLQKAENKLRSDAISSYADTVQKLNIKIETERFVGKFDWDKSLYLPAIEVNGKKYLLSESSSSFSLNNISTFYSKVLNLAMTTSKPDQKSGSSAASVAGPLYVNHEKTAIFFPLSDDKLPALKTLSYSNLKQRGTQNLTLFKANSYGRETADLQGRCSLGLTDNPDGSGYLYIRNSQQGSELQAALGDFVLSKEGEFVGIVVAMRSSNLTAKSEAVCWILPEKMEIEKFQQLRLNKKSGSAYFEDFSADFRKVFSIIANAK